MPLQQVTEHICKLARKGMTPSQIGVLLRDSHGIPQVSSRSWKGPPCHSHLTCTSSFAAAACLCGRRGQQIACCIISNSRLCQRAKHWACMLLPTWHASMPCRVIGHLLCMHVPSCPPPHPSPTPPAPLPRPQVRYVTGTKVLRILKGHGLAPEIPEDLYHLIKKAVSMRKHMERNRKDKDSKFRLILIESRIHRLARYYKVWELDRMVSGMMEPGRIGADGAARWGWDGLGSVHVGMGGAVRHSAPVGRLLCVFVFEDWAVGRGRASRRLAGALLRFLNPPGFALLASLDVSYLRGRHSLLT